MVIEFSPFVDGGLCFMTLCFLEDDFAIDFEVKSRLGNRTQVRDLPKLTAVVVDALRAAIKGSIVAPNKRLIPLPVLGTMYGPDNPEPPLDCLDQPDENEDAGEGR
jgi:hypothetical protein